MIFKRSIFHQRKVAQPKKDLYPMCIFELFFQHHADLSASIFILLFHAAKRIVFSITIVVMFNERSFKQTCEISQFAWLFAYFSRISQPLNKY